MRLRQRGITLIESMTALALACVLVAAGAPALSSMLSRSHQQSAERALQESLLHARELAVARRMRVVVCPSADGVRCSNGEAWQHGWMIGADADRDREPDSSLARFDAMPQGMHILASRGRPRIIFQPDGSAGGSNAQLTVCNSRDASEGRAVIVSNSGRVRTAAADFSHLHACLKGAG